MTDGVRSLFRQAAAILGEGDNLTHGNLFQALQLLLPAFCEEDDGGELDPQILEFRAMVRPLIESKEGLEMTIQDLDANGMQLVASLILAVELRQNCETGFDSESIPDHI